VVMVVGFDGWSNGKIELCSTVVMSLWNGSAILVSPCKVF